MINVNLLKTYALGLGIELKESHIAQFDLYASLLLEWNRKINLTSITDPVDIVVKHYLDSLILSRLIKGENINLIDVGTGAGFPGIPIKIVKNRIDLTLLDSLKKRIEFLRSLSINLKQDNICIHGRAEEFSKKEGYREVYNYVTARAVAPLNILSELCLPFVEPGGFFLACKGPEVEKEILGADYAINKLGGKIEDCVHWRLPNDNIRRIVVIKKISHTPAKYPRNFGKIAKKPL